MGRPRMIIVIRHAQSEGNRNRSIHQTTPDHRVKLTPTGWEQAEEAGRHLRSMLKADDTIQLFISPYRRTRETTDGILKTLTSDSPNPSPFPRQSIKVWEEPRLREQDFGNFQPNSDAMERMWRERADYGHFFYRIPNGESAADAYDRISGFNESLWRQFSEPDFPSVCVLVTHGLMTRVFLMKWYHWSVEYFEDLRNVGHCEFVVMERKEEMKGRYQLQNRMRTWSELKRQREDLHGPVEDIPKKRWGSQTQVSRDAKEEEERKRPRRQDTAIHAPLRSPAKSTQSTIIPSQGTFLRSAAEEDEEAFPQVFTEKTSKLNRSVDITSSDLPQRLRDEQQSHSTSNALKPKPMWLQAGRDFGGSESGMATPAATGDGTGGGSPQEGYGFPSAEKSQEDIENQEREGASDGDGGSLQKDEMDVGARADALGDQGEEGLSDAERRDESVGGSMY